MVEVDITLKPGDLYDYNLKHSYSKPVTILCTVVGILGIAYGIYDKFWIMVIIGALLVVYTPLVLFLRSSQAFMLNPSLKEKLHYILDDEGLTVSQKEQSQQHKWGDIVKAVSTTNSIIIYTTKINATIIPKREIGDSLPLLVQEIAAHLEPSKNKIKS